MAFSGSLLNKNRAALEEIADAMALDHSSIKLRTELIDRIRLALQAEHARFSTDDRFKLLYGKPRLGRPSSRPPASFKEEQDLTATVQVPLAGSPPPSSHLASQSSAARRSPRLSSTEPRSPASKPAKHTASSLRRSSQQSAAAVDDADELASSSSSSDAGESESPSNSGAEVVAEAGDVASHVLESSPLKALASPLKSALSSLGSPIKPTLARLASPLKPALSSLASRVSAEVARAREAVDGAENAVEGAVEGAGFRVRDAVHQVEEHVVGRPTRAAVKARKAVGEQVARAEEDVEDRVSSARDAIRRAAADGLARVRSAVQRPSAQTAVLLLVELVVLLSALLPTQTHVLSFPPSAVLSPIDRKTDFAHLYPPSRPAWLRLALTLPTAPSDPLAFASALLAWALSTLLLPSAAAHVLSAEPTDKTLVFWLVRLALLALGHAGWRADGWGSGSGRAAVVVSALGAGLGVARGLGEARVGGVRR